MNNKVKVFLAVYVTLLLIASYLTLNRISPLTFPTMAMLGIGLLPLVGTYLLLPGILLGGLALYLLGEQKHARNFIIIGIILDLAISVIICNVFRTPVLASVGERYGSAAAVTEAEKSGEYRQLVFQFEEQFGYLQSFLRDSRRNRDKETLKKSFMAGYKQTYQDRYPDLIDQEERFDQGYRSGYYNGYGAGRNAGMRNEPFVVEPIDGDFLSRLQTDYLPVFVDGFQEGYGRGWEDGWQGRPDSP